MSHPPPPRSVTNTRRPLPRATSAAGGGGRSRRLQAYGGRGGVGTAAGGTRVDQDTGLALRPEVDRLAVMAGGAGEAEGGEEVADGVGGAGGEFREGDTGGGHRRRGRG